MADEQIEALGALTAVATGDELLINDVSDTTDDANGTAKKITYADLHAYGEITAEGNSTALTISSASTDWSNAVQVTTFGQNGASDNTTPDHTNDHITIDVTGVYFVKAEMSFSGGSSDTYSFALYKNNKATILGVRTTRALGTGGDVGSASISTVVSLTATDTVEVWIQNETVGADATVQDASLSVFRVG